MSDKNNFHPGWYEKIAPVKSYRSIFKWGAPDVFKHPNKNLYSLMKQRLDMTDEDFRRTVDMGEETVELDAPINLPPAILARLKKIVGAANFKTDDYSRLRAAYGKTMLDLLRLRRKIVENLPDAVVCPRTEDDIKAIVRLCNKDKIPITVFGGGTSVTRGVECIKGGISLDMRPHMNRILTLNPVNQTVTVQPGIMGPDLEKALNDAKKLFNAPFSYTCGHFPQSFEFSTVGGWILTKGAGQNSTYYGKIEHMVISQRYITPAGMIITRDYPADAIGPDIDQIMIGSEGAFGILVSATLKIFRYMPKNRRRFSFMFADWPPAVKAAREILQSEIGFPSVMRLSDPEETDVALSLYGVDAGVIDAAMKVRGYAPGKRCLMIGWSEGETGYARNVKVKLQRIAKDHGAMNTTGFVTKAWEHGRFRDPYLREDLLDYGVMIDTLECAVPWDGLMTTWKTVRDFCHSRPKTVCMCHMSHLYTQGANLYFIFIARMDDIDEYVAFQGGILDAIRRSGAALSHHHGIGKLIAPWFEDAVGRNQLAILKALKKHFDPRNIMNPGGTLAMDLPKSKKRPLK